MSIMHGNEVASIRICGGPEQSLLMLEACPYLRDKYAPIVACLFCSIVQTFYIALAHN
jgi:hypothetical protein